MYQKDPIIDIQYRKFKTEFRRGIFRNEGSIRLVEVFVTSMNPLEKKAQNKSQKSIFKYLSKFSHLHSKMVHKSI